MYILLITPAENRDISVQELTPHASLILPALVGQEHRGRLHTVYTDKTSIYI